MKYCGDCGEVYFADLADATHCLHCVWENDSPKALIYRSGKHARNVSEWTFTTKVNDACED